MKISSTTRLERLSDRYRNGDISRRTFLTLTAAAAASTGLSMPWMGRALAAVSEVRFDGWGGVVQDAFDKYAFQPYTKKTGIKVVQGTFGDEDEIGMTERRKLAYVGHVAVNVLLDREHRIVDEPDLVTFGVPEEDAQGELMEDILLDAAIEAIDSIPRVRRKDPELVRESVRRAVRAAANHAWGKKPVVTVFVNRIH